MENSECIFCKIARGEIPCAKIWEDEKYLAFLDINPNTRGMTLVIPKKHFDSYAIDMNDKDYSELFLAAKNVAKLLDKKLKVKRTAIVLEGLGVNHVHVKLYPIYGLDAKFKEIWADEKIFFEKYQGYITTQLGPKADVDELNKLAEDIKEK
ncbi:HIT domain-containing protein [Candidatus Pacearchaeota archaeon]|nr:HIT domain-containing protein [Candidatus Pacearchaeota archaeon]